MKKVVYALFDDGNQSVKKALEPLGYEVYSFGIQKKDTVINCDLTNISDFFYKVSKLPKPDFIFANPPCETFSGATNGTYKKSGRTGNKYYYHDKNEPVTDFDDWKTHNNVTIKNVPDKRKLFNEISKKRDISEKLHKVTEMIVNFYNVPYVVENPRNSIAWKMFYKSSNKHLAKYICYDKKYTTKPTFFASNVELNLKKDNKGLKQEKNFGNIKDYNIKSSVPKELILDIISQIDK